MLQQLIERPVYCNGRTRNRNAVDTLYVSDRLSKAKALLGTQKGICQVRLSSDNMTPAAIADPITPATLGPIACIIK